MGLWGQMLRSNSHRHSNVLPRKKNKQPKQKQKYDIPFDTLVCCATQVRVVLNKADMDKQKMMRVYGALMWSLGKVIGSPG